MWAQFKEPKMPKNLRTADRSNLRIADLKARKPTTTRLINMKIPGHIAEAISRLAEKLGTTKTELVIALLSAGLEQVGARKKK
jgi:hypothetical protein